MPIRLRNGKWYLKKKVNGKFVGLALGYKKDEVAKALIKAGQILEKLERGEEPSQLKNRFEKFVPKYWERFEKRKAKHRTDENRIRNEGIIRNHLLPWFGEMKMGDIDEGPVLKYMLFRETPIETKKRTIPGAVMSTLKKELRVLKDFMVIADSKWELPELDYKHKGKKQKRALTIEEVLHVQKFVFGTSKFHGHTYEKIYEVLSLTGMDIKDAVYLRWEEVDLRNGWIRSDRFKSGQNFGIPICQRLYRVFESLQRERVRSIDGFLFPGINNKQVSTALNRAFETAGFGQFCAKSLRHFVPSMMEYYGMERKKIRLILGHSENSRQTDGYIHAYPEVIKEGFSCLDKGFDDLENGREATMK